MHLTSQGAANWAWIKCKSIADAAAFLTCTSSAHAHTRAHVIVDTCCWPTTTLLRVVSTWTHLDQMRRMMLVVALATRWLGSLPPKMFCPRSPTDSCASAKGTKPSHVLAKGAQARAYRCQCCRAPTPRTHIDEGLILTQTKVKGVPGQTNGRLASNS